MRKLSIVAGVLVLTGIMWGCDDKESDGDDDGASSSSSGDTPNTSSSSGASGTSGDGGTSGSSGDGGSSGASSGSSGSTSGGLATSCSSATMLAGNPAYDGDFQGSPVSGTGIRDATSKPLEWHDLVFDGQKLYSRNNDGELWMTDLSAATPVETRLTPADDPSTYDYRDGACTAAHFAQIRGMGKLADGSLVIADQIGNGILHVTNPSAANCAVEYWAGNHTATVDIDPSATYPNEGDVPGAGADAKLSGPAALDVDASGNVFFWDTGNRKIKKVAADAAHTVSDVAPLPESSISRVFAITHIGNTLYAGGDAPESSNVILAIDATTGAVSDLVRSDGGEKFDPYDIHEGNAIPTALTTDGTGLIVQGLGYMWYVTTAGVVSNLYGSGTYFDVSPGYDPGATQTGATFEFLSAQGSYHSGSITYVTYHDGAVYYRGRNLTSGAFVERIACP